VLEQAIPQLQLVNGSVELLNGHSTRPMLVAQISKQAKNEKEKIIYSGFTAQVVEIAANETGCDFSGVDAPKNEKDLKLVAHQNSAIKNADYRS
jgi:hypothetical protein